MADQLNRSIESILNGWLKPGLKLPTFGSVEHSCSTIKGLQSSETFTGHCQGNFKDSQASVYQVGS